MLVCGVDFETTGLDFEKDSVIEIGAVIFDDENWEPIDEFCCFVKPAGFTGLSEEIKSITGICDVQVFCGIEPITAFRSLKNFFNNAQFVLAHNKNFDETFFKVEAKRAGLSWESPKFLCTVQDIPHGKDKKCRKLSHLALDYGVVVDPTKLHRALDDVFLMGRMLKAAKMKISDILGYMNIPWVYLEAVVEAPWKDNGKSTGLAKKRGFSWETPWGYHTELKFAKRWVKKIKKNILELEIRDSPFPIVILKEEVQNV